VIFLLSLSLSSPMGGRTQDHDSITHVVYIIGNSAQTGISDSHLSSLKGMLLSENHPYTILHLGDIFSTSNPEDRLEEIAPLFDLTDNSGNGLLILTPGDKDWNNSGEDGLGMVRGLEEMVKSRKDDHTLFLPSEGCPGPEIVDVSPGLRIIILNTQWWMHPFDVPEAPDSECSNLTREEIAESIEEAIEESGNRNVLIAGHHPVVSAGVYGGYMPLQKHLFPLADVNPGNRIPVPILGSFYAAYRQNVGTVRDMANEDYQEFIDHMSDMMSRHPGLVYASAHDYSLQLLEYEEGFQVISGSITEKEPTRNIKGEEFAASTYGYSRLEYYQSGKVRIAFFETGTNEAAACFSRVLLRSACDESSESEVLRNPYHIPCMETKEAPGQEQVPYPSDPVTVTGGSYPAKGLKKILLGSLHRETWQTPVTIPYLALDTVRGGITPFALGGGRQTTTLKFRSNSGYEYAFRSVDKNLVNALPRAFRKTFVAVMIKEVTATEYPYGAIIASALLDQTDILHARPTLYVLPDHPSLGAFREPYSGLFGMLEDRPRDPNDQVDGFMGADDVTRSAGLFRKLYRDNDNIVDAEALGKARVFDMLIGDWGRHEDNWKWAGYNRDEMRVYYPIPRDRDHAFCRWNGVVPYLANREWAMPMVESFDYDFHGIKSLTWPARHVDRSLLTELDRKDWERITSYVQRTMTDEVIDDAINVLPPEVLPVSGREIGEMLKSRRAQLPEAVDRYYGLLAREVEVVGSNKHESFEVERLENGNVRVEMYKKNKEGSFVADAPLYSREFIRKETREVHLYGLDGNDIFTVSGRATKSIPVRIIGGPGDDRISDLSRVKGMGRHTMVYDNKSTTLELGPESKNMTSDDHGINHYDRKSFAYNTYFPKPLIYYSSDDGFVASLGLNVTTHGFRKEEFKGKYDFYLKAGTVGNVQFGMESHWKEVMGCWDVGIFADYGRNYPYYNFFGLGNQTIKDPDLFDEDYYRVDVRGLMSGIYTETEIFKQGLVRVGLLFENLGATALTDSILGEEGERITGAERVTLGGINASFYLDFRDRQIFATRGIEFLAENTSYATLDGASGNFGLAGTYLKYFGTFRVLIPVTLAVKLGGSKNYGNGIPFYKYTFLGQFSNLKGYKRNRFTGDASAYLNSEIRLHLGKVRNLFLPFETGLIGFYDVGKVWFEGVAEGKWHAGYGGGFYISPITRDYLFTVLFEFSPEEKLLFRFGFGFMLDN